MKNTFGVLSVLASYAATLAQANYGGGGFSPNHSGGGYNGWGGNGGGGYSDNSCKDCSGQVSLDSVGGDCGNYDHCYAYYSGDTAWFSAAIDFGSCGSGGCYGGGQGGSQGPQATDDRVTVTLYSSDGTESFACDAIDVPINGQPHQAGVQCSVSRSQLTAGDYYLSLSDQYSLYCGQLPFKICPPASPKTHRGRMRSYQQQQLQLSNVPADPASSRPCCVSVPGVRAGVCDEFGTCQPTKCMGGYLLRRNMDNVSSCQRLTDLYAGSVKRHAANVAQQAAHVKKAVIRHMEH